MITMLYVKENANSVWTEHALFNLITFDERLDEQFDSGNVLTINASSVSFADFCMAKTVTDDGESQKIAYFSGFDTVEKRGANYYVHTLELVEPTRLLMGILIDGRKVSQPVDGSAKKSLLTVLEEFIQVANLLAVDDLKPFIIDEQIKPLLASIESPEFHWEAETLFWECLLDMGNVINCIPRVIIDREERQYNVLTFDKINEVSAEYYVL